MHPFALSFGLAVLGVILWDAFETVISTHGFVADDV